MAAGLQRWVRTLTRGRRGGSAGIPPALELGSRASSSSSSSSSSNRDTLPGPYPETPEEHAAAARKYNMAPGDYRPHPDRGEGYGDYPALPDRSQHERDPWYAWDHPDLRRNWGEPMHWDFDMYTRNRVDTSPSAVPWRTACAHLLGFLGVMALGFYLGERFPAYQAVAPKQYPYGELYLERGGHPDKRPSGRDNEDVRHYEI